MKLELSSGRGGDAAEKYQVVVSDGRWRAPRLLCAVGTAAQVNRLLPGVRYCLRRLSGKARREALKNLERGFQTWKSVKIRGQINEI